ncbi:MAG: ABC transporter permease [Ignavibacteriae bacterium]|nr:ABC transporter permease [Ignavibacteriota bacterium]NOG96757.1 ABC transporter permease [Ignavibacteriota bacterium]
MKNNIYAKILKRFFSSLLTIFLIITFIFILVRISPGDPTQKYISPELSPQLKESVAESFNLNEPLPLQYLSFVINLAKGDFGISYNHRMPVLKVIWEFLPFTLIFAAIVFIFQILVSLFLAIYSVKNINGFVDKLLNKLAILFYVTPVFVAGLFLVLIFSVQLNLFPSSGLSSFNSYDQSFLNKLIDYAHHLFLPLITLSLGGIAIFYKYLRDNIVNVMQEPFVLNLHANGYSNKKIFFKHILPNAVNPLISIAGIELGLLLSGTLITEVIFSLPGFGRLMIDSIMLRDYPLVVGCSFIASVAVVFSNLAADLIKFKIDKRMIQEING